MSRERFEEVLAILPVLALPLEDHCAFELGKSSHPHEHEVRHWRVLAGKGQVLPDELDAHAALGESLHQAALIVEIACQAVHAVHLRQNAFS